MTNWEIFDILSSMRSKYIKSAEDFSNYSDALTKAGGKFSGLYRAAEFLEKLEQYDFAEVRIPQTFVIDYETLSQEGISDALVADAMQAVIKCGGRAAVRSSADVEDMAGKSMSGAFDSVLNVTNAEEMRGALNIVRASAEKIKDAKMSIIVQEMIAEPKLAGVAYSEEFDGDAFIVINAVEGRTAEKLLLGQDNGIIMKVGKYVRDRLGSRDDKLRSLSAEIFLDEERFCPYMKAKSDWVAGEPVGMVPISVIDYRCPHASKVAWLCHELEKELKHPVDMEFAVTENEEGKPVIHLLQQRPYVSDANFKIRNLNKGEIAGYPFGTPKILEGEVVLDDEFPEIGDLQMEFYQKECFPDVKGKILVMRGKARKPFTKAMSWTKRIYMLKNCDAALKLGTFYHMMSSLYDHCGNTLRDSGVPFLIKQNNTDFDDIHSGDYLRINLETGAYKVYPRHKLLSKGPLKKVEITVDKLKAFQYGRKLRG